MIDKSVETYGQSGSLICLVRWLAVPVVLLSLGVATALASGRNEINVAASQFGATAKADALFSYQGQVSEQTYHPTRAIDGNCTGRESRWVSEQSRQPHFLEIAFAHSASIHRIVVYPDYPASTYLYGTDYVLQYWSGDDWKDVQVASSEITDKCLQFEIEPVQTIKIRYFASRSDGAGYVKLYELEAYAYIDPAFSPVPLTFRDYPDLSYELEGEPMKLTEWKALGGDNPAFASPDFDDADWTRVRVGEELKSQIPVQSWAWYRVAFVLPETFQGSHLLFDLGCVSVYDELFVNGTLVGSYGTPPPKLVYGASSAYRRYPIPASALRAGRNVLAIRVFLGFRSGLSEGRYTLQPLAKDTLVARMELKSGEPADALLTCLTDRDYLNSFVPGSDLLVRPSLTRLFGDSIEEGELDLALFDDRNNLLTNAVQSLAVWRGGWTSPLFRFIAPVRSGHYQCTLTLRAGQQVAWTRTLPFTIIDPVKTDRYDLCVDSSLDEWQTKDLPADISSVAVGRYGPRQYTDGVAPANDFSKVDSRAGLALSSLITEQFSAPVLFMTHVRPTPKPGRKTRFHMAAGHVYDGLDDAWILGKVVAGGNLESRKPSIAVVETSWTKRTCRYSYRDGSWLDLSLSAVSPAIIAQSNTGALNWFADTADYGIGLPTGMAYEEGGKLVTVDSSAGIDGTRMTANYLLVWFNGAEGWEEFDIPLLFVFENRPRKIALDRGTLGMTFAGESGRVQMMPLNGVTLQTSNSTASWLAAVPKEVHVRCRYWSRVLVNAPDQIQRRSRASDAEDRLIVQDAFTYLDIRDVWATPGLKIALVPPTLPLAAAAGTIDIRINKLVKDTGFSTLYGPLLAADGTETLCYGIGGMLNFIREVRKVTPAQNSALEPYRTELNRLVGLFLDRQAGRHPWDAAFSNNRFEPGLETMLFASLHLCLPYLNDPVRKALEAELKAEVDTFLLCGVAAPEWQDRLGNSLRDKPLVKTFVHPVTKLELSIPYHADKGMGIDAVYFEARRLYAIWQDAHTFGDYDRVRRDWEQIKRFFNVIRSSHDWAIGLSWDSLSGLRLGSGLQESGGMHVAGTVMARMASEVGDTETKHQAAYISVASAVAMQAALNATDYLKWRRPWCRSHSYRRGIERDMKSAAWQHVEFNELGGFSQFLIGSGTGSMSPTGFIETPLPEIMRLYQEVWPEITNDFYDPGRTAVDRRADGRNSLDAYVYQITRYPQTVEEIFEFRRSLPDTTIGLLYRIIDYRAYLDYKSKIDHAKLW